MTNTQTQPTFNSVIMSDEFQHVANLNFLNIEQANKIKAQYNEYPIGGGELSFLEWFYNFRSVKQFKVGDFAVCSQCGRNELVKKLYGGKPVCFDCCKDVYK